MNHQTRSENHDWYAKEQRLRLEAASPSDQDACRKRPDTGADAVDIDNVRSLSNREIRNDLQKREEHAVPHVKAEEDDGREEVGAEDGAVPEQMERDESDFCSESFPERKRCQHEDTQADHAADHS